MKRTTTTTLPLGIDFGHQRIRVALTGLDADGRPRLLAVASRETCGDPARALCEARSELGTRERRCVVGISRPDACLHVLNLPPMSRFERAKTASFQAARYIDYPVTEATISLARLGDSQRWALGIARRASMKARLTAARQAKLIPLAVDDNALALARVYGDFDGSIDISAERTHITVFAKPIPWTAHVAVGGTSLTEGIARSLGIDAATAEERKRAIGFAGAGEVQRDALIDAIDEALANARASGLTNRRRFVLVGNGSRIPGLAEAIERATGYDVRTGSLTGEISDTLPADVLRAASVDWSIAFGLSVWQLAS